ncbi:hypothetical protein PV11_05959 [Exophiala sideris]|uniref:Uncharacterized protein n=1 Tax=Exophiala sideris TaxID=1016849 RepID=A0A0D1YRG3_9EURO|nr:hypothetical protein PV11_05959 [Exophiala sideris]
MGYEVDGAEGPPTKPCLAGISVVDTAGSANILYQPLPVLGNATIVRYDGADLGVRGLEAIGWKVGVLPWMACICERQQSVPATSSGVRPPKPMKVLEAAFSLQTFMFVNAC